MVRVPMEEAQAPSALCNATKGHVIHLFAMPVHGTLGMLPEKA